MDPPPRGIHRLLLESAASAVEASTAPVWKPRPPPIRGAPAAIFIPPSPRFAEVRASRVARLAVRAALTGEAATATLSGPFIPGRFSAGAATTVTGAEPAGAPWLGPRPPTCPGLAIPGLAPAAGAACPILIG